MRIALLLLLVFATSASSATPGTTAGLTREKALFIAEAAAQSRGFNLNKYSLAKSDRELSGDGKEWSFLYECRAVPSPFGCHFLVVVNRITGEAEFVPGM
jgi:hypothetical protein